MKKLTATGVTDSRIFLLTTTTSAHSAVMPNAAAIQLEYVLVATPRRLPAVYRTAGIIPGTEIPARARRVEDR
jgi:hypothetical protein